MMHERANILAAALLLPIAALVSCARRPAAVTEAGSRLIKAVVVKASDQEQTIESFGTITYKKNVDLSTAVEGTVERFTVKEGDYVRAGQVLVRLRNMQLTLARDRAAIELENVKTALTLAETKVKESDLAMEAKFIAIEKARLELEQKRKDLQEAERKLADQQALRDVGGVPDETVRTMQLQLESQMVQLKIAEQDFESLQIGFRDKDLVAFGRAVPADPAQRRRAFIEINTAMARAELDAAKARVRTSEMELQSANIALDELVIVSPVSGVVGAKYYEEGERAKASEKIVTIMDTEVVYAIFPVREEDVALVAKGSAVVISVDASGGPSYEGVIDLVSPSADPSVGAFMVKALVKKPDARIKPGMFARVTVKLGKTDRVATVPVKCLLNRKQDKASVLAIVGGKITIKEVVLGKETGDRIAVLSGLSEGELIAESPDPTLTEGSDVEIAR